MTQQCQLFSRNQAETFIITAPVSFTENIQAGISSRHGGESAGKFQSLNIGLHVNDEQDHVIANRHTLAEAVGVPLENWVFAEQTHRDQIVKVPRLLRGSGAFSQQDTIRDTDALYTQESGIVLALLYADCIPIYFHAPQAGLIGIAHAGWQGTVYNIAGKMVKLWKEAEGAVLSDIHAVIGPGISKTRYEVDQRIIKAVDDTLSELQIEEVPYQSIKNGKYLLDLKEMNMLLLRNAGLHESQIHVSPICVYEEESHFFSHRRDQGGTGRMAAWITQPS